MKKSKLSRLVFAKNSKNEWHWTFYSRNNKKIAWSGETYKTRAGCRKGWESIVADVKGDFKNEIHGL